MIQTGDRKRTQKGDSALERGQRPRKGTAP
jgi:hypothetical protein